MKVRILREAGHEEALRGMSEKDKFDYLAERVRLDKDTGQMFWVEKSGEGRYQRAFNARYAGKEITSVSGNGYKQIRFCLNGRTHHAVFHRLVWYMATGEMPSGVIDHIDGDKRNNSIKNLRDVTQSINMRNAMRRSDNKSGVAGIHWSSDKKSWVVQGVDSFGKHMHVGIYKDRVKAEECLCAFKLKNSYTERHGS